MYPSNSPINGSHNTNILNSHTILDQTTLVEPYTINNPNPDHSLSSFFYQLPSPRNPYEDEAVFLQHLHELGLLQQHLHQEVVEDTTQENQNKPNTLDFNTKDQMVVIKKRTSKKDRHSKINTAQGPRDRRMRLSLDVAREFFDLQDLLGFDKASKTVEWLLIKSGEAIKELTRDPMKGSFISFGANYSASSTSECEVISGPPVRVETEKPSLISVQKPKKLVRGPRKPTFLPRDKEARVKARERARERTKDKRRLAEARLLMNPNPNSDLGDVDQEMMFSYDDSSNGVYHEHQFTNYQVYAKQWEAYSA